MIFAGYAKVAPMKARTRRVILKFSPGSGEWININWVKGKKSIGSGFIGTVRACMLAFSMET